jgi:hypothetical protein
MALHGKYSQVKVAHTHTTQNKKTRKQEKTVAHAQS